VFLKERSIFWEVVVSAIVRNRVHVNMSLIMNVDSASKIFFTLLTELWFSLSKIL